MLGLVQMLLWLAVLCAVVYLAWLIVHLFPIPAALQNVIWVIVVLFVLIWLLSALPAMPGPPRLWR